MLSIKPFIQKKSWQNVEEAAEAAEKQAAAESAAKQIVLTL